MDNPTPGARVLYIDGNGTEFNAIVTQGFPDRSANLVYVGYDLEDSFGIQIHRGVSVPHVLNSQGTGNFWCWPGEEKTQP